MRPRRLRVHVGTCRRPTQCSNLQTLHRLHTHTRWCIKQRNIHAVLRSSSSKNNSPRSLQWGEFPPQVPAANPGYKMVWFRQECRNYRSHKSPEPGRYNPLSAQLSVWSRGQTQRSNARSPCSEVSCRSPHALDLDPTLLGAAPSVVRVSPGSSRSVTEPDTASEPSGQELVIVGMAGHRNGPSLSMRYDDDCNEGWSTGHAEHLNTVFNMTTLHCNDRG